MKSLVAILLIGAAIVWWWLSRGEANSHADSSAAGTPVVVVPQPKPATPAAASLTSGTVASAENAEPTASALVAEIDQALRDGSAAKRDRALYVLMPRLVASDPGVAAQLALTWKAGLLREELLRQLVLSWIPGDTQSALKWLTSLPEPADRNLAAAAAIDFLAQNDPASAIELSLLLGLGTQDGSVEHKVQLWTEEKPKEAVAWALARPAGAERDQLLARIAYVRAQQDPVEAGLLVLNQMTPGAARDDAIISVVHQWAMRDPATAATWVAQFPPSPLQTRALAELETTAKQAPKQPMNSSIPIPGN